MKVVRWVSWTHLQNAVSSLLNVGVKQIYIPVLVYHCLSKAQPIPGDVS